ncbi:MAG: DUF2203 family protein [Bdellovibrionaceae bacterium]|nr:DUF2203 family protein [Pseudobdellovibrionaceae bacterium]
MRLVTSTESRTGSQIDVVGINRRSVFNLSEARAVLPVVSRLTKQYSERVQNLIKEIEGLKTESPRADLLESEAGRLIQEWQSKIQKLGGLPKGMWIVDFDSGDGYFCWKFPEKSIQYWHHYRDGFTKRVVLPETSHESLNRTLIPT